MFIFICDFLRFFSCDNIYTFTSFRPLKLEKKKKNMLRPWSVPTTLCFKVSQAKNVGSHYIGQLNLMLNWQLTLESWIYTLSSCAVCQTVKAHLHTWSCSQEAVQVGQFLPLQAASTARWCGTPCLDPGATAYRWPCWLHAPLTTETGWRGTQSLSW